MAVISNSEVRIYKRKQESKKKGKKARSRPRKLSTSEKGYVFSSNWPLENPRNQHLLNPQISRHEMAMW